MDYVKSVAVFCGSRSGKNDAYRQAAAELGSGLGRLKIRLVYGGARDGIMGTVADAVLGNGGTVLGVIPAFLTKAEHPHPGIQPVITDTMHERKMRMYNAADAFAILSGGIGTFDEFFEVLTWRQLFQHHKPIIICNINRWADLLIGTIENAIQDGFTGESVRNLYEVVDDVPSLLRRLETIVNGQSEVLDLAKA